MTGQTPSYVFGQTYWVPKVRSWNRQVPCPVCDGKKEVVVICGDDRRVIVACSACGNGFDGPRGYVMHDDYAADAEAFTPVQVHAHFGGKWTLKDAHGLVHDWDDCCLTREEAVEQSRVAMQRLIEDNHRRRAANRTHALEGFPWTVRYHRECIQRLEKQIAWHRQCILEQSEET